ncbi:Transcription initiation factor TFIID subunit 9B [Phlyctochytrium bullatum]|nr:Transcription initiation factor TFIID subunit 9B [Phlyctochytrium bullatum]
MTGMDIDPTGEKSVLPPPPPTSSLAPNATVQPPPTGSSSSSKHTSALPPSVSATWGEHQDPLSLPKDAKLVSLILQAMAIPNYDPRVLPQLLEFMHRYVLDILADAQLYAEHASRTTVEIDDIRLAVEGKVAHSFTSTPSKDVLAEMAQQRNAIPLPLLQDKYGLRLPPERNCLTGVNFNIIPQRIAPPAAAEPTKSQPSTVPNQPSWAMPSGIPAPGATLSVPRVPMPPGLPANPPSLYTPPQFGATPAPPPLVVPAPTGLPAPPMFPGLPPPPSMPGIPPRPSMADTDDYDDFDGDRGAGNQQMSQMSRQSSISGPSTQRMAKAEDEDYDMM